MKGLSYVKGRRLCLCLSNSSDREATGRGLTDLYNYLTQSDSQLPQEPFLPGERVITLWAFSSSMSLFSLEDHEAGNTLSASCSYIL